MPSKRQLITAVLVTLAFGQAAFAGPNTHPKRQQARQNEENCLVSQGGLTRDELSQAESEIRACVQSELAADPNKDSEDKQAKRAVRRQDFFSCLGQEPSKVQAAFAACPLPGKQ